MLICWRVLWLCLLIMVLSRTSRSIISRRTWCTWNDPSACSVSCEGTGFKTRVRICKCYSYNLIKNIKNLIASKCRKNSLQEERISCNTGNVICPPARSSPHRVYWILGGVVLALVSGCLLVWCFVGWLQGRRHKREREERRGSAATTRRERRAVSRERSVEIATSPPLPTVKPPTPPPPPYNDVIQGGPGLVQTQVDLEPPPPSYGEAIGGNMTQTET